MNITITTGTDNGLSYTRWEMTDGDAFVGMIDVHTSGLILNIEVANAYRGEGHARTLYETAAAEVALYHVPAWGRTPEGEAFAEAMGGDTMDDDEAAEILGLVWDDEYRTYLAA